MSTPMLILVSEKAKQSISVGVGSVESTLTSDSKGWMSADTRKQSAEGKAYKQPFKQQVNHKGTSSAVVEGK